MDQKAKQADLNYQLGLLLKPVLDIIEKPEEYGDAHRRRVRARFQVDREELESRILRFCKADPSAVYARELHDIQNPLGQIGMLVHAKLVEAPSEIAQNLEHWRRLFSQAVAEFPVDVDAVIYDANTPFSAYCFMRSLCETTKDRIVFTDRYVSDALIPRLFQYVPSFVEVVLVTWPREKHRNSRDLDAFLDVSRLYAKERPGKYRLLVNPTIHDRWLICDDQFYHLGGSAKDAADTCIFTVSRVDTTAKILQMANDLTESSTELFGPSNSNHP